MKVLCFGSLNIDYTYSVPHFVAKGETLPTEKLRIFCGGKGLNQSVALSRAGLDVRGGGPASRESQLLNPLMAASVIHGIVLAGGSAFGLGTADGVMRLLPDGVFSLLLSALCGAVSYLLLCFCTDMLDIKGFLLLRKKRTRAA